MWLSTYLLTVYSVLKPHVPNIFLLFRLWAFFLLKSILRVLKSHFHKVIIFALWNWLHPHCSGLVNQCIVVCPQDFCFWWAHVGNYACNNVLVKRNPERPVHEIVSRTMNSSHSGTLTGVWLKWKGFIQDSSFSKEGRFCMVELDGLSRVWVERSWSWAASPTLALGVPETHEGKESQSWYGDTHEV